MASRGERRTPDVPSEGESRIASISAAVLAWNEATAAPLPDGRSPVAHLAELLGSLFEEVLVVGGGESNPLVRRVPEPPGPTCALGCLVAALENANAPALLAVDAASPLVPSAVVLALVASPAAPVVVPSRVARPSCALLDREVSSEARRRLATGHLELSELFDHVGVAALPPGVLGQLDPDGLTQLRIDTPEGRSRAEAWLAAGAVRP